jgi:Cu/Ag efflux pump CusA
VLNFRRVTETLIVMLSLPFALAGGVWLTYALGFNMSGPFPQNTPPSRRCIF